ncbi:hypothetical protein LTR36_009769 [Oleoguttula mirabilis]|uniref:Uncharacterized protein n=1 Tax=Oleoguttula mirabilis TaxID=1507867 RepID=A0AAV9J615_9PEZI|nr:hypothetical protein LTR36_009769 [Oleoguttula mirabilis]
MAAPSPAKRLLSPGPFMIHPSEYHDDYDDMTPAPRRDPPPAPRRDPPPAPRRDPPPATGRDSNPAEVRDPDPAPRREPPAASTAPSSPAAPTGPLDRAGQIFVDMKSLQSRMEQYPGTSTRRQAILMTYGEVLRTRDPLEWKWFSMLYQEELQFGPYPFWGNWAAQFQKAAAIIRQVSAESTAREEEAARRALEVEEEQYDEDEYQTDYSSAERYWPEALT